MMQLREEKKKVVLEKKKRGRFNAVLLVSGTSRSLSAKKRLIGGLWSKQPWKT